MMSRRLLFSVLCLVAAQAVAAPRVVVSIAPLHSLVAGVMEGVSSPVLLVSGAGSPHSYLLKPSQRRALSRADLIVWAGVESFLPGVLASLGSRHRVLEMMALKGMILLPVRRAGEWRAELDSAHHHHDETDGHLWLDPRNAKVMVKAVADELALLDVVNAPRYRRNAGELLRRLDVLDAALAQKLSAVQNESYMVFHDAYQYFEARYGLGAIAAVSVDPGRKPGARRMMEIRQIIHRDKVKCVFREPQFSSDTVAVVLEGGGAKSAVLDPMGNGLPAGPEFYFRLMRRLADDLAGCLL